MGAHSPLSLRKLSSPTVKSPPGNVELNADEDEVAGHVQGPAPLLPGLGKASVFQVKAHCVIHQKSHVGLTHTRKGNKRE